MAPRVRTARWSARLASLVGSALGSAAACSSPFAVEPGRDVVEPLDAALPGADGSIGPEAEGDAAPPRDVATDALACNVRVALVPPVESPHVPEGTPIVYGSNPPSSGPHYPIWANFQEYASPVDDGYLVHSMEHGAVLLLYRCDLGTCPADIEALRAVRDAHPNDLLCDASIRTRIILAPRPTLDVAIAAAAWGATYRADCVDASSLTAFVAEHYAKAPENFCTPGRSTF